MLLKGADMLSKMTPDRMLTLPVEIVKDFKVSTVEVTVQGRKEWMIDLFFGNVTKPGDPKQTIRRIRLKPELMDALQMMLAQHIALLKDDQAPSDGATKH